MILPELRIVFRIAVLVFARGEPTAFAGRGKTANQDLDTSAAEVEALHSEVTTAIDVSAYVEHKIAAIAAHRTQCPITPGMLPLAMFQEMMGREYFVRIYPPPEMETALLARSHA